jgi:hypothetical protein
MDRRRAGGAPALLRRVRWDNVGRLVALLAAGVLVAVGGRGCEPDPPAPRPDEGNRVEPPPTAKRTPPHLGPARVRLNRKAAGGDAGEAHRQPDAPRSRRRAVGRRKRAARRPQDLALEPGRAHEGRAGGSRIGPAPAEDVAVGEVQSEPVEPETPQVVEQPAPPPEPAPGSAAPERRPERPLSGEFTPDPAP